MKKQTRLALIGAMAVIFTATFTSCSSDPDDPVQYTVTVTDDGNGTAVVDKTKAEAGMTVTLTATPAEGFVFSKWTVQSGGITLSPNATTTPASFTMPEGNVSVKAEFAEKFIAVTNITGVPQETMEETPLQLSGTITPENATNKTITWSIADAGSTGATISDGNTLNTTGDGSVIVRATIANGTAVGTNYTKDFTITVTAKPTDPGASTETTAEFDNSNFGLYKGVIAGSSGTIKIEVGNGNNEFKAILVMDKNTDNLTCTTPLTKGQAIINAAFTGASSSFKFSVDADGKSPVINDIKIDGHSDVAVSVIKETSADVAHCYEGVATGGNDHTGVLNIVRNGNTYSGMQKTTGPTGNLNNGLSYLLDGSISSDGTFSGSATVEGHAYNPNYDPDVPGSKEIIAIDIILNYSGRFDGDNVSGTWTTLYVGESNSGSFSGKKTL